jgi:hypothetical protein
VIFLKEIFEELARFCFQQKQENYDIIIEKIKRIDFPQKTIILDLINVMITNYYEFVENIDWFWHTGRLENSFLGLFYSSFVLNTDNYPVTDKFIVASNWLLDNLNLVEDPQLSLPIRNLIEDKRQNYTKDPYESALSEKMAVNS